MDTEFDFANFGDTRRVYVRAVKKADLPEDLRDATNDLDEVYAIYAEDGAQLAVVKDRALAFAVARTNDFTPVSVH